MSSVRPQLALCVLAVISLAAGVAFQVLTQSQTEPDVPRQVLIQEGSTEPLPDKPTEYPDSLQPPKQALFVEVATLSGQVSYVERTATQSAAVSLPLKLVEGEKVTSSDSSSVQLSIPQQATIALSQNSSIQFSDLQPQRFLIKQLSGRSEYTTQATTSLSIRVGTLLLQLQPNTQVLIDRVEGQVEIKAVTGSLTTGFIDKNNETQVQKIEASQTWVYQFESKKLVQQ